MMREPDGEIPPVLEFREVTCTRESALLRQVSLRFAPATFNVLVGDVGALLLLRLASLQETPDSGEISLLGQSTAGLDDPGRAAARSRHFGFVFSSPYLLPGLSVAENVAMPLFKVLELESSEASKRTSAALDFVGFHSPETRDLDDLGRFDQQRIALARALAHRPALLVLDRMDAGLDPQELGQLLDIVRRLREEFGVTVFTIFAAEPMSRGSDRILAVEGGIVCRDTDCAPQDDTRPSAVS